MREGFEPGDVSQPSLNSRATTAKSWGNRSFCGPVDLIAGGSCLGVYVGKVSCDRLRDLRFDVLRARLDWGCGTLVVWWSAASTLAILLHNSPPEAVG